VRFASVEDIEITAASMDLRARFPNELKYGLDARKSSAMQELRYTLKVASPAPRQDVLRLVRRAEANCHAAQSLRQPVPVQPRLELNGEDVPLEPA
jgi:organic hydroperoxide reductase OsmC/OhrA